MKKILLVCLLSLFLFGCSTKNDSIQKNKSGVNSNTSNFKQEIINKRSLYSYEWNCEVKLNEIKDINRFDLFISKTGELYEFSLLKKYSTTNTNCKKIDTDLRFEKFINGVIVSIDNKLYRYDNNKLLERPSGFTGGFDYRLYDYNHDLVMFNAREGQYGIIKDNKVYKCEIQDDIVTKEIFSFNDEEKIIGVYGSYIRTDKGYYYYGITNQEQCSEYKDIKCEYGIVKDELFSKSNNDIVYANGMYFIIESDNKLYEDNNYYGN